MTMQRPQSNYSDRGSSSARANPSGPSDSQTRAIIVDGSPDQLVTLAETVASQLVGQNLTTSQIRNVYGTVRQIQLRWDTDPERSYREAVLLRPKLAYFSKREKGTGMETLKSYLEPGLKLLSEAGLTPEQKKQRFNHFTDFFEAIVAYHKAAGGK